MGRGTESFRADDEAGHDWEAGDKHMTFPVDIFLVFLSVVDSLAVEEQCFQEYCLSGSHSPCLCKSSF